MLNTFCVMTNTLKIYQYLILFLIGLKTKLFKGLKQNIRIIWYVTDISTKWFILDSSAQNNWIAVKVENCL